MPGVEHGHGVLPPDEAHVWDAANEVAVHGFLDGKVGFLDIPRIVETTLERAAPSMPSSLDDVYDADDNARDIARTLVAGAGR